MKPITKFGIDIFLEDLNKYKTQKIALVSNLASVTSSGVHSRLALLDAGFNIVRLFAPEHGFDATGDDGAFIDHQMDAQTKLPIVSLYSEKLAPSEDDLNNIDLVIIDLPDIGARFYTYLWTMSYVLESCEKFNKKVLLLDRPNPMAYNIDLAEGPLLDDTCSSFIGRFSIPVTHQCTFGELAQYFKAKYYPNLHLEIIKMQNWDRSHNSGYSFFPTSPAIQQRHTVYTYPGACLFEGLNINEGRGSDYPFAQFGAPWINAELLHKEVTNKLAGAKSEIVEYIPTSSLYANQMCYGLRITPIIANTFLSFQYFLDLIKIINDLFPDQLKERDYLTNVNPNGTKHLDKLIGIPNSFQLLKEGKIKTKLAEKDWSHKILPHLLY